MPDLVDFILEKGVVDAHAEVRSTMLQAGTSLIEGYGKQLYMPLVQCLESVLQREAHTDEDLDDFDRRRSAGVVLLGASGRHLDKSDPTVIAIIQSLIESLSTPSESVQRAVANCLIPLVALIKGSDTSVVLLEKLIEATLGASTYGQRRGSAFGLSAFVKALGIPILKQLDVVPRLKEACTTGSVNARQGSLFAIECLCDRLGLLFEPYIITIIPILLKSFSHSSDHVREAAQGAAKVIMAKLSAHGVKQVLTPIISSLPTETAWKTRQESLRLLGMMAHCAPRQLSACLPQIVPCLVAAGKGGLLVSPSEYVYTYNFTIYLQFYNILTTLQYTHNFTIYLQFYIFPVSTTFFPPLKFSTVYA